MERTKNNTLPLDRMQELETYAMAWSSPVSDAVRAQVEKATASLAYVDMASGPMMRGLLGFLVRASKAQRVLEIGTFIGTSAMGMAEAMDSVRDRQDTQSPHAAQAPHAPQDPHAPHAPYLLTIDKNKRYIELVKDAFSQEPYATIIESVEGDALAMLKEDDPRVMSTQPWDLLFLDGDKAHYPDYIKYVVELIRVGGVLVIDNVLWYGHVLDAESIAANTYVATQDVREPDTTRDEKHKQKAVAIDQMNKQLAQDPRLSTQILPFGDGVTLATRIQ